METIRWIESEPPAAALETTAESPGGENVFQLGQVVEIAEGAFMGMTGVVKEIDSDKGTVKLEVNVFGRPTAVEVPYSQLKR